MIPDAAALLEAAEATWPPAQRSQCGPVTLRAGAGGGKRVSAATVKGPVTGADLDRAEAAMRAAESPPLFQLREGDTVLDSILAGRGYALVDPVIVHVAPVAALTGTPPPRLATFTVWEPLAIMRDIWAEGGIGPERLAVMERVEGPKTALFARHADRPAGAGFVAVHEGIAMVHALHVRARHRRAGVGRLMLVEAALWAASHGARHLALLCVETNAAANGLCSAMGFSPGAAYHYRLREER